MTHLEVLLRKHPIEIQKIALKKILQEGYKNSLWKTSKYLCGYSDMTWHTHGKMIEVLEDSGDKKLIVMPRGTFKSSIATVAYSIWRLIRNSNERILLDSEVYNNSKNFLREIKAQILSDKFIRIFGDWRTNVWNESEIIIEPRTQKSIKEASITCGGVGTVKVGQHYSVIIEDDLNSLNNSDTPEGCQKVIQHYQMNLPILDIGGTMVVIGTRYAANDVIGHILENEVKDEKEKGLLTI